MLSSNSSCREQSGMGQGSGSQRGALSWGYGGVQAWHREVGGTSQPLLPPNTESSAVEGWPGHQAEAAAEAGLCIPLIKQPQMMSYKGHTNISSCQVVGEFREGAAKHSA